MVFQQAYYNHDEHARQGQVERQAEGADRHALLYGGQIEHLLLAKNLQRNQQHADADFAAREHADAERETLAQRRFTLVGGHGQAFSDVADDSEKNDVKGNYRYSHAT